VLLHGSGSTRANVLDHAAALAARGYGVLILDARGHGESGGQEMDFGWFGDVDIAPAVDYLRAAPDVAGDRVALVGMSMGGEEAIGAAASMPAVRAVVAEGVTGRVGADWLPMRPPGIGRVFSSVFYWVQERTAAALSRTAPPVDLRSAVVRTAPRSSSPRATWLPSVPQVNGCKVPRPTGCSYGRSPAQNTRLDCAQHPRSGKRA
jgi:uncharacterized protein